MSEEKSTEVKSDPVYPFAQMVLDHAFILAQQNPANASLIAAVANAISIGIWSKDEPGLELALQANERLTRDVATQLFQQAAAKRKIAEQIDGPKDVL